LRAPTRDKRIINTELFPFLINLEPHGDGCLTRPVERSSTKFRSFLILAKGGRVSASDTTGGNKTSNYYAVA
jgi:hypothetical protein